MAIEAANLDKNLGERQHLREILQHGMRKITKMGYCGAQRKKAFQGRSGSLHQILPDFQNRRKKKNASLIWWRKDNQWPLQKLFLWNSEGRSQTGYSSSASNPPYIKWFCPSKTKWLYILGLILCVWCGVLVITFLWPIFQWRLPTGNSFV